jgi:hypothetical protein
MTLWGSVADRVVGMGFTDDASDLVNSVFGRIETGHGVDEPTIGVAEKRLGVPLPAVLREYYRLLGKHREVSRGMNRLLAPSELCVSDGALVFAEENQGVFLAGILVAEIGEEDPAVGEDYRNGEGWHLVGAKLSSYLLVTFCWQACNVLPSVGQCSVERDTFARIRDRLRWASFGVEAGTETFGLWGEGVAAVFFAKSGDLYVACQDDERLEALGREWGVELSVC